MPLSVSGPSSEPHAALLSYRPGRVMACPACGERQWLVGRIMAQCACCDAALPIDLTHGGWSGAGAGSTRPKWLSKTGR